MTDSQPSAFAYPLNHPLTIRPITARDVLPLARTFGWPEQWSRQRFLEHVEGKREAFVADMNGLLAGSVSMKADSSMPGLLNLFALDVAPNLQRQGIGTTLVAYVETEASVRGYEGVYLDVGIENYDARRLYERLGYIPRGEPCERGWHRPNEDGTPGDWVSEITQRMFKRF